MRQERLTAYEQLAIRMFDSLGKSGYSGVLYNCRAISDSTPFSVNVECMALLCMN